MSNETPTKTPIEFDLGLNGGIHKLSSVDEISEWINAETARFEFVQQHSREFYIRDRDVGKALSDVSMLLQRHREYHRNRGNFNQSLAETFVHAVTEHYKKPKVIHSNSRRGGFILNLAKTHPAEAAWIWWTLSGAEYTAISGTVAFSAAFKLLDFEGQLGNTEVQAQALASLDEQFRTRLVVNQEDFDGERRKLEDLRREIGSALIEIKESQKRAADAHSNLVLDHSQVMADIQDKYHTELAVRAAVTYWNTKASEHQKSARLWGQASIGYGLAALLAILWLHNSMSGTPPGIQKLIDDGSIPTESVMAAVTQGLLASAVGFLPLALLIVWPVRILLRNYLSERHLATDAAERSMIVRTYVALVNDPDVSGRDGLKEQVLPQALQGIFRHAADGIVKDDGMPLASAIESIRKGIGA